MSETTPDDAAPTPMHAHTYGEMGPTNFAHEPLPNHPLPFTLLGRRKPENTADYLKQLHEMSRFSA